MNPFALSYRANQVLSIAILMIIWWVFEAVPMPVVALIPIILFPSFGIAPIEKVVKNYADPVVFLFMGGFIMALAIEKWDLHKRMALGIIRITGTNGNRIILGFIFATGFLSLWLSNTATTMMMFPIAISVIHIIKIHNKNEKSVNNFSLVLMLSIAYASNFAVGTIIATPPNVAYVGYIKNRFNYTIGFVDWLVLFLPLTLLLLFMLYWVLVKIMYPNSIKHSNEAAEAIKEAQAELGSMNIAEKRVLFIFTLIVILWIAKDFLNELQHYLLLDDTIISMSGALLLFLIPSGGKTEKKGQLMSWLDTKKMAWDVLLLFGGGIALAGALETSNLIQELGSGLAGITTSNTFLLILIVTTIAVFLSELISNLALVIILSPILTSLAILLHINPLLLGVPMTLGASCASMFPMGTPSNAIVFAKGHISIQDMMRTGFVLNIICIILITFFCWLFLPMMLKMNL
ncbi:MAG: DASS family sodium-coupled anion symporter [Flavobacterium sp. JAD_PAG50586_2]|nr:MAG: DASS family sodium-coupled anion symporter [Flavobacterium sp. JAD_PAG50586_2]